MDAKDLEDSLCDDKPWFLQDRCPVRSKPDGAEDRRQTNPNEHLIPQDTREVESRDEEINHVF